jgi:hypothetical protein
MDYDGARNAPLASTRIDIGGPIQGRAFAVTAFDP